MVDVVAQRCNQRPERLDRRQILRQMVLRQQQPGNVVDLDGMKGVVVRHAGPVQAHHHFEEDPERFLRPETQRLEEAKAADCVDKESGHLWGGIFPPVDTPAVNHVVKGWRASALVGGGRQKKENR